MRRNGEKLRSCRLGHQLSCCLVSLNFQANILSSHPNTVFKVNYPACRMSNTEGSFIQWSTTEWELTMMKSTLKDRDQICRPQSETLIFPGLRNFKRSKHLCKQFQGSIVVIKNKTQSDFLNDLWWKRIGGTVSPFGSCLS